MIASARLSPLLSLAGFAALVGLAAPARAGAGEGDAIGLHERLPATMLIVVPKEVSSAASSSELLDAAVRAFRAHTGLELQSVEQAGFDADKLALCPRKSRMTCWVLSIRPDRPHDDRSAAAAGAQPSYTRVLLVLNVLPLARHHERVSTLLFDTDQALRCYRGIDRKLDDWETNAEDCIYATAVHKPPEVIDPADITRNDNFVPDVSYAPPPLDALFLSVGRNSPALYRVRETSGFGPRAINFEVGAGPVAVVPWPLNPDLMLVEGTSRAAESDWPAYVSLYDARKARYLPGARNVGHGPAGRILRDDAGRLWFLLPWEAKLLRLTPTR